jgi:hypothetical protein
VQFERHGVIQHASPHLASVDNERLFSTDLRDEIDRMSLSPVITTTAGDVARVDSYVTPSGIKITSTPQRLRLTLSTRTTVVIERRNDVCSVRLAFGSVGVGPDVSVQPGAVTTVVDDEARARAADPNAWRRDITVVLAEWEPTVAWCSGDPALLTAAIGALTHPLIAALHHAGATALTDIPRWLTPLLRSPDLRSAVGVLSVQPTRRLVRALGSSLTPVDGRLDLAPVSLAVAAGSDTPADLLANLLEAGNPPNPDRLVPTVEQVRAIERGVARHPADRRVALLTDAVDDPVALAQLFTQLSSRSALIPDPPPTRVRDLHDLCRQIVPVLAPRPASLPEPVAPAPPADADQAGTAPPPHELLLTAPQPDARRVAPRRLEVNGPRAAPTAPSPTTDHWPLPDALTVVHGLHHHDLTFVVPTTALQLSQWGVQLRNCLSDYHAAVAGGRTWLVGIEQGGHPIGCIEIVPSTRRLRQAYGRANRPLPPRVRTTALGLLTRFDVLVE